MIIDITILKQQKLQCNSRDISVSYIIIYKKRNDFLTAPPDSLNGAAGVHPTSEVFTETAETDLSLSFDCRKEFQNRGPEHMHVPIHLVDAPKIYESEDSELVDFIDNYITCALPDEAKYLEISNLIKKLQCHHYTTTCK